MPKEAWATFKTKRGCPFSCIYCTYPLIEGRTVRLRSPRKVADEAEALLQQGVSNVFIVDNIFNFPQSHAHAVCKAFIERAISLQWSCYAHTAYFSRPLAEELKKAGCTGVEFGTDSGSPPVLARLGKNFSPEDIRRATLFAREAGLEVEKLFSVLLSVIPVKTGIHDFQSDTSNVDPLYESETGQTAG